MEVKLTQLEDILLLLQYRIVKVNSITWAQKNYYQPNLIALLLLTKSSLLKTSNLPEMI